MNREEMFVKKINISAIVIFALSVTILVLAGVIANMYDGDISVPRFFESNIFFVIATSLTVSLVFFVFSRLMFPNNSTINYENFPSTDYVVDSMKEDIGKSDRIICFTARGDTATKIIDRHLSKIKPTSEFIIILADKDNPSLSIRASALNMTKDDYITSINSQVANIQIRARNDKINVKTWFHKQPICFRFIMLDNCIYWGFYEDKKTGTVTDMFKADSASVVYKAFCQYYELLRLMEGWK